MSSAETSRASWEFLTNTYWYVTPPDLPSLRFRPDKNILCWQGDQTVWHITQYLNGYFWGVASVATLDPEEGDGKSAAHPEHFSLIGTVTGLGTVQITFILESKNSVMDTIGIGKLIKIGAQWSFQMQMSTRSQGKQLLHWANMMPTNKDDASWGKLPGIDASVPEMLSGATYPHFANTRDQ